MPSQQHPSPPPQLRAEPGRPRDFLHLPVPHLRVPGAVWGGSTICRQAQPEQRVAPQWVYYFMAEGGVAAFNHQISLEMGVFTVPCTPGCSPEPQPFQGDEGACPSLRLSGTNLTQFQAVLRMRTGPGR